MGRLPRRLQSSVIVWRARIPRVPRSRGCRCCVCLHQRLRKQCTSFPPSETGIPFRILFLFLCFEVLSAGLVCYFVTCALAPEDLSHDWGLNSTSEPACVSLFSGSRRGRERCPSDAGVQACCELCGSQNCSRMLLHREYFACSAARVPRSARAGTRALRRSSTSWIIVSLSKINRPENEARRNGEQVILRRSLRVRRTSKKQHQWCGGPPQQKRSYALGSCGHLLFLLLENTRSDHTPSHREKKY